MYDLIMLGLIGLLGWMISGPVFAAELQATGSGKSIRLIVQGDDMGSAHAANQAFVRCYLPRAEKGSYENISNFDTFYRADHWAKDHPIFDGLPSGGIMDYRFYRDIIQIKNVCFTGITNPQEAVAGAVRLSGNAEAGEAYGAGLMLFIDRLGSGRFLVNDLKVRQQLGINPVAERLLRNMLNYMARRGEPKPTAMPSDGPLRLQSKRGNRRTLKKRACPR
jgi:hypothetical protein